MLEARGLCVAGAYHESSPLAGTLFDKLSGNMGATINTTKIVWISKTTEVLVTSEMPVQMTLPAGR